jgi:hypothetical protein
VVGEERRASARFQVPEGSWAGSHERRCEEKSQVKNLYRRSVRLRNNGTTALAALAAATVIAACGSSSPSSSGSSGRSGSDTSQAQAQPEGLSFARCMRSHGVSSFPDPSANGGFNISAPGINPSSPAFRNAETACASLRPVKQVQSQPPSAQAYARLLHWAKCMREHGMSGLPDPRPDPPPAPGSPETAGIGTLMGDGGYWVGTPATVDAHSPAFVRLSTACGESPGGHRA